MTGNSLMQPSSMLFWGGTGTLLGLVIFASTQNSTLLTYGVLVLAAAYSIFGVCYGVWAAREATKRLVD